MKEQNSQLYKRWKKGQPIIVNKSEQWIKGMSYNAVLFYNTIIALKLQYPETNDFKPITQCI